MTTRRTSTTTTRAAAAGGNAYIVTTPFAAVMNDAKAAVETATDFLASVVEHLGGIRLEEIEPAERGLWVTLSYLATTDGPLAGLQAILPRRMYKRFHVIDGAIHAMKMRDVVDA